MSKFVLITAFICLTLFYAHASIASETKEFATKDFTELMISNPSGDVQVTTTEATSAVVTTTKKNFSNSCEMTIEVKGHTLNVKVEKKSSFSIAECNVDFAIKAPKNLNVTAELGAGNLVVSGTNGDLNFRLGNGNLNAKGLFKKVDGRAGNGKVEINGLDGNGVIKAGNGDVDLIYAAAITKGSLDLNIGRGDATITLPKSTKVKTHLVAGMGRVDNEFTETPDAAFSVSINAGLGNLKVKSY